MRTKPIATSKELAVKIPNCTIGVVGQVWGQNMTLQTSEYEEFMDFCDINTTSKILFYRIVKNKVVSVEGCVGCPFYTGKER